MDLEALRSKKQLNVQEQNALAKQRIRQVSKRFRDNPESLPWLSILLANNGLSSHEGILVELSVVLSQGEDVASGFWLTESERFYEFEVSLSRPGHALQETSVWREATSETSQSAHRRGTGRSFGCLALEVLRAGQFYVFKPTAEDVARIIHTPSPSDGFTRRWTSTT